MEQKINHKIEQSGQEFFIDGELIDESVFQEEKVDYKPVDREQQINDLYMWIGEAVNKPERAGDLSAMKEDLRYLESLSDELVFSNIFTNEFISMRDDPERFNEICEEIIKLQETQT